MIDELSTFLVIRNYFAANGFNSPDLIILLSRYLKHYCSQDAGCGALHGIKTGLRSAECSVTRNIMSRNTNKQLSGVRGDYKV